jgi:mannose-1-phosphate guanylyltransferase
VFYPDEEGNIVFGGDLLPLDTHHSLVYGSDDHKLIVTIGVDDLVIVNTKDVLLVCHRAHTQKVRQIVGMLKDSENKRYL